MSTPDPVPDDGVPALMGDPGIDQVLLLRDSDRPTPPLESWLDAVYATEVGRLEDIPTTVATSQYDVTVVDLRGAEHGAVELRDRLRGRELEFPVVIISATSIGEEIEGMDNVVRICPPVTSREIDDLITSLTRRQTYRKLLELDYQVTSRIHELRPDGPGRWDAEDATMTRLVERKQRLQSALHQLEGEFTEGDYAAIFAAGFR